MNLYAGRHTIHLLARARHARQVKYLHNTHTRTHTETHPHTDTFNLIQAVQAVKRIAEHTLGKAILEQAANSKIKYKYKMYKWP